MGMSSSNQLTKNLRSLTPEDLINTLVSVKSDLLILRQKKHSAIVKPSEIKQKRQEIARINTILYEQKVRDLISKSLAEKRNYLKSCCLGLLGKSGTGLIANRRKSV